jgi:hypothetical protein
MAQKRPNQPKRWGLKRPGRLASARGWVAGFTGLHLIRAYAKRYRVDELCAAVELQILGAPIEASQIEAIREKNERRAACRKQQREAALQKQQREWDVDSDDTFAYIAGYTSAGAPYGVTWDEWRCGVRGIVYNGGGG